jgi:hypothetical protein
MVDRSETTENEDKTMKVLKALKDQFKEELLDKKGVVSCGVGYKAVNGVNTKLPCIVVGVKEKLPPEELSRGDLVPKMLTAKRPIWKFLSREFRESALTDVVEIGEVKALHTQGHRPAMGGISIGHVNITAGTFSCLVKDAAGEVYILSNNHVLAMSNEALEGDDIIQPGAYDKGEAPKDVIAKLTRFVPISMSGVLSDCPIGEFIGAALNKLTSLLGSHTKFRAIKEQSEVNLVDAAIAKPVYADQVVSEIMDIGKPVGVDEGMLGVAIKKSGRTTGYTEGIIEQVDVTVQVQYGEGKIATFEDQLVAGKMCAGVDSGSAVLTMDNRVVGLLFAGSETSTVINRIQNVLEQLELTEVVG